MCRPISVAEPSFWSRQVEPVANELEHVRPQQDHEPRGLRRSLSSGSIPAQRPNPFEDRLACRGTRNGELDRITIS